MNFYQFRPVHQRIPAGNGRPESGEHNAVARIGQQRFQVA